jgi:hypothetical protein
MARKEKSFQAIWYLGWLIIVMVDLATVCEEMLNFSFTYQNGNQFRDLPTIMVSNRVRVFCAYF